jgi:hypothetical protein
MNNSELFSKVKKQRNSLTFAEKFQILAFHDFYIEFNSVADIAKELKLNRTTLISIIENREYIEHVMKNSYFNPQKKHFRKSNHPLVDDALWIWVNNVADHPEKGLIIDGESLRNAGEYFQISLEGKKDILQSYIQRWRERVDVKYYSISGEASGSNSKLFKSWFIITLPKFFEKYNENNIFNIDETGVFYRMLPNKTFSIRGNIHGVKENKERFTAVLTVSMSGEKIKPLIVGKHANPQCFPKIISQRKFIYDNSINGWVNGSIFLRYLTILNVLFKSQNRSVCIIVDNCSCNTVKTSNFSNIELFYLSPNTTSIGQPLDAVLC